MFNSPEPVRNRPVIRIDQPDLHATIYSHLIDADRYVNYLKKHTHPLPLTDERSIVVMPIHREETLIMYPGNDLQLICVFNDTDQNRLTETQDNIYEEGIVPISVLFKSEDHLSNKIGSIGMARAIGIGSVIETLEKNGYDLAKYRIYWQDADSRITAEDMSGVDVFFEQNNQILVVYTQTRILFHTKEDLQFHPIQLLSQALADINNVSKFISNGELPKYIGGPRIVTRSNFYKTTIEIEVNGRSVYLDLFQAISLNHYDEDFVFSEIVSKILDSRSVVLVPQVTMVKQRHNKRGASVIAGDAQMNRTWARNNLSEHIEDIGKLLNYLEPDLLNDPLELDKPELLKIFSNLREQNTYFDNAYAKEVIHHLTYSEDHKDNDDVNLALYIYALQTAALTKSNENLNQIE